MNLLPRLERTYLKLTKVFLSVAFAALLSCQGANSQEEAVTAPPQEQTAAADTVTAERRPAPQFHKIPTGLAKKRVYICSDEASDTFHVKHDCPVLVQCKGTFRNVTLLRAVEDYDRYQCETCSQDLAFIFEEGSIN